MGRMLIGVYFRLCPPSIQAEHLFTACYEKDESLATLRHRVGIQLDRGKMQALHKQAEAMSGIPRAAVEEARGANLYNRIGAEKLGLISEKFYEGVYNSDGWFRVLFANTTREAATRNQREFLAQEFGGPRLYEMRKGCTMLLGRHGPYAIDGRAAKRWVEIMEGAVKEAGVDGEEEKLLVRYFQHMAWVVVFGRELVNPRRTVGYFGKHQLGEV